MGYSNTRYALLVACTWMGFATQAQPQAVLTRHVPAEVTTGEAVLLRPMPPTGQLRLNLALPLRNEEELDQVLNDLYDPACPFYHRFLSVEEFTERFGPAEDDYAALVRFAQRSGFIITGTAPNRLVLNVTATAANIESAFHVAMGVYQHPSEPRTFYSPDREPAPDTSVPLWHITGLDNFSVPRPASLVRDVETQGETTGSGPSGNFLGSDMRAAYYSHGDLTGKGQSVGLLEFAGYNIADVDRYFSKAGQKLTVRVTGISTDGSSLRCAGKCDDSEQVLDIEEAISMAPGMTEVRVYVSDTSDVSILNRMATDNISKSLSCSWGWKPADPSSDDPIFKEFAAQGQNIFVSSGDNGAYKKKSRFIYPADDALVVAVGGTDLKTDGAGGAWKHETAWSDSGGGVSPDRIPIPKYQTAPGVITKKNDGSKVYRNAPDVAAEANTDNYICYNGTCAGGWGGTSFSAPRWAGYLALVNEESVSRTDSTVGFLNPSLYRIGLSAGYASDFHDIVRGDNRKYSAVKGFDLVTGWGSPNGTDLIEALTR